MNNQMAKFEKSQCRFYFSGMTQNEDSVMLSTVRTKQKMPGPGFSNTG